MTGSGFTTKAEENSPISDPHQSNRKQNFKTKNLEKKEEEVMEGLKELEQRKLEVKNSRSSDT